MNDVPTTCKYVRNKVNCQIWSGIDFEKLHSAVRQFGKNWNLIQQLYFPERRANCLKCKYNYYLRKQNQPLKLGGKSGSLGFEALEYPRAHIT